MEPPYPPRRQSPRTKGKYVLREEEIPRAEWDPVTKRIFMETVHDEVIRGNFQKGILIKQGWKNVQAAFRMKTNRPHKISRLENLWGKLKQEWVIVKNLLHQVTGAGLDESTGAISQDQQLWAETIAADKKMAAYANQDLRHWRDMGPIFFDSALATGQFAVAPSIYSNTQLQGRVDTFDSDPDSQEGSGDSGDNAHIPPIPFVPFSSSGRGSGSSGKRKTIDLNTCMLPSVRRRLPPSDFSMGSAHTTGTSKVRNKDKQSDHVPSVKECMDLINYLESKDIDLYAYALSLLREDVNRQILAAIPTRRGIEHWLNTMRK